MKKLTVLMTVFNGAAYLRETVESILGQSYKDFKFLILDNASTDESVEIIRSYGDPRIHLEALPENIGQVGALNKGLDMIDTPLVARMDADDISLPTRLERQMMFMEQHPEIGICGTFAVAFNGGKETKWAKPCAPDEVKARLLFGCCMVHPSVMMRKDWLDKYELRYNEAIGFSEDWDLWLRAVEHFPLANIPEYLLRYRIHGDSVSSKNVEPQKKVDEQLINRALKNLGLAGHPLHEIHKEISLATTYNARNRDAAFIGRVREWFDVLTAANAEKKLYDNAALQKAMRGRLFIILRANAHLKSLVLKLFLKEHLYKEAGVWASLKLVKKLVVGGKLVARSW